MTRKQERIIASNNFIYFISRIKKLETEVKSLKDDWLMCDEVCDQKTQENRELIRLARNVVVGKQKLSDLEDYLKNQILTKLRTDMFNEEKLPKHNSKIITDHYLKEEK